MERIVPSGDYGEGKERKPKRPVDCGQWRDGVEVLSSLKTESPANRNWYQKIRCGVCFTGGMVQSVSVML